MESKKFIEIKKPVEEVREVKNKEQKLDENKGSKVIEKLEETVLPTVHASDEDDARKIAMGANAASTGILTAICPPAGIIVGGLQAATGTILKQSDDPQKKKDGEVLSDAAAIGGGIGGVASVGETVATQGVEGIGEMANQVVETIKKL